MPFIGGKTCASRQNALDVSGLAKGIYFYRAEDNALLLGTGKVVKE